MENVMRRGITERNHSRQSIYEDFHPFSNWTHDSNFHVLLIDVPGFKKEELKVEVVRGGKVRVSGEKKMNRNKFHCFKKVFDVPSDSDMNNITGRLDGGLLIILIPRKITVNKEELKEDDNGLIIIEQREKEPEKYKDEEVKKGVNIEKEYTTMSKEKFDLERESFMEKINENKMVILGVVLALSAGLYLSHKIRLAR
ncbi:hypothetical protein ACHQM5_008215 [Ranunculus cassubicifolius]